VWKLAASRFGNNRWIVYSFKLRRLVILYSDLEYDHWVLVESDYRIVSFCEQPLRIRVRLPSGFVTSVFDMWVLFASREEEFREIKYRRELEEDPLAKRQVCAQSLWCSLKPAHHELYDELQIRANPLLLSNWKKILRCLAATHRLDLTQLCQKILQLLANAGAKALAEIESHFPDFDRAVVHAAIFRLLHDGRATAPLENEPLSGSLPVEVRA
jgi:hypothetical protein